MIPVEDGPGIDTHGIVNRVFGRFRYAMSPLIIGQLQTHLEREIQEELTRNGIDCPLVDPRRRAVVTMLLEAAAVMMRPGDDYEDALAKTKGIVAPAFRGVGK